MAGRLLLTALGMIAGMSAYEAAKQALFPTITVWQSHVATVIFSTIAALLVAFIITRKTNLLIQRIAQENALVKKTEKSLQDSERQYREYIENAPYGLFVVDDGGRCLQVNPALCRITGYTASELLAMPITDLCFDEDRGEILAYFQRLVERGENQDELVLRSKSGDKRWWSMTAVRISPTRFIGFCNDISARRQAQEALLESERKFKGFAQQTLAGLYLIQDGVFKYVNPKFAEMFGYSVEECLDGRPFEALVHPEDRPLIKEQVDKRTSGQAQFSQYTFRGLKKNGQIFHVEIYGSTAVHQGRTAAIGTLHDISDRKRAEELLARANRQNEMLLNSAGDGIFGLDSMGRTIFSNPVATRLVGYPPEEIIGQPQHDLIHHTRVEGTPYPPEECPIYATFKDGQVHRVDTEVFWRKDRTSFPVAYTSTPMRDEKGQLEGAVVVFKDITEITRAEGERKRLEQQVRQAQKAESLGRMAGAIAHNFNNQLSVVIGYLELVVEELPGESDLRAQVTEAIEASHRAAEMSGLMLLYLGQTTDRLTPLKLSQVICETLPTLDAKVPHGVRLTTEIPEQGPSIYGNALHIQQIVTNLVSNAVEALDANAGQITVGIRRADISEFGGLRLFPMGWEPKATSYVCLFVADTGPGMDAAALDQIFDPFVSTKFIGRGLGLPVVLGLVRIHDGAIAAESNPGQGSVFKVFLPAYLG